MSILSDRRSLREIGGVRAYVKQVGWSLWWRTQSGSSPPSREERNRRPRTERHTDGVVASRLPASQIRLD